MMERPTYQVLKPSWKVRHCECQKPRDQIPHQDIRAPIPIQFLSQTAMTTPDLVSRFDTVHAMKTLEDQDQALQQMSHEELSRQPVLFGEAKKGKFGDVVQKDPAYCRWFLKKWGTSPKAEHRMFTHFLR